jgi:hypothetical protein
MMQALGQWTCCILVWGVLARPSSPHSNTTSLSCGVQAVVTCVGERQEQNSSWGAVACWLRLLHRP